MPKEEEDDSYLHPDAKWIKDQGFKVVYGVHGGIAAGEPLITKDGLLRFEKNDEEMFRMEVSIITERGLDPGLVNRNIRQIIEILRSMQRPDQRPEHPDRV
ncbi:MAG: hypothetical protein K2X81_13120 [Candidatus Obscuribacterales bacterium]|nr:hypothetical protein [Candidatus Obscuribacterales bacterium]